MKIIVPDYYSHFNCIASRCKHTCCAGWEVDIDDEQLEKYRKDPYICSHIEYTDIPHFRLTGDERCPFLTANGLCDLILHYGTDILCQICRDHPRFRNYWTGRTELGLGLVCEEAGRIILSQEHPMQLTVVFDDGEASDLSEDEKWLIDFRDRMLGEITETGPRARLWEYLVYRHLADALYDDRVEERVAFIKASYQRICSVWAETGGSLDELIECARQWSYDVEYDDDELKKQISSFSP